MERGELGAPNRPSTVFVFEDLIAHLERPRVESIHLRLHQWNQALRCWTFDQKVCDYMYALMSRFDVPVDVFTWHSSEFAVAIHDALWERNVPVRYTTSGEYRALSPWVATDENIALVYDADPAHRFGYGFKAREFSLERF